MRIERTLQRADPLGALAGRRLTIAAGAAVGAFALVLTFVGAEAVSSWPAAVLAVALACIVGVYLALRSHPRRGAIGRVTAAGVLLVGAAAYVTEVFAMWGAQPGSGAFGPYVLALLLLALVPYRPVPEVLVSTAIVALVVGAIASWQEYSSGDAAVPGLAAIAAIAPVVALPLGGAAFSSRILGLLDTLRSSALVASEEEARRQETAITRAVQQTRVGILNREVVPFYADLARSGRIEDRDLDRAGQLAASLRAVMLAETERSWLDEVVGPRRLTASGASTGAGSVHDPESLASAMGMDQRTALRALIAAVRELPGADEVTVTLVDEGESCEALLLARLDLPARRTARHLRPYLAVMSAVFTEFGYDLDDDEMTVRFCFDRP
jgi:hypothetical protein